jgi:glycosyltransferase involved in cell wall biosynthesis
VKIGLYVFVVDDGNSGGERALIETAVSSFEGVTLLTRGRNGGKGAAVRDGFQAAAVAGYTHALQIDADGQHDPGSIPAFLEEARKNPAACVCGLPQFDDSVPQSRLKGRRISNKWARIDTLSDALPDVLCGFRLYPLKPTLALLKKHLCGSRMDFDPQILVRLYWVGTPITFLPVPVYYPKGGVSNFNIVADNIRLSFMWMTLFFGMLVRFPKLLRMRKRSSVTDWHREKELGRGAGIRCMLFMCRHIPSGIVRFCSFFVAFFYWVFAPAARAESRRYLDNLRTFTGGKRHSTLVHFASFALTLVEKVDGWMGKYNLNRVEFADDMGELLENLNVGRGAMLLISHIGNSEILRALADMQRTGLARKIQVISVADFSVTESFNKMLGALNKESMTHFIPAANVGIETIGVLKDCVDNGGCVVIAADRT